MSKIYMPGIIATEGRCATGKSTLQKQILMGALTKLGATVKYFDPEELYPIIAEENPDDMYDIFKQYPEKGKGKEFLRRTHYIAKPKKRLQGVRFMRWKYADKVCEEMEENPTDITLTELTTISEEPRLWGNALCRFRTNGSFWKQYINVGKRNQGGETAMGKLKYIQTVNRAYGGVIKNAKNIDMDINDIFKQGYLAADLIIQRLQSKKGKHFFFESSSSL